MRTIVLHFTKHFTSGNLSGMDYPTSLDFFTEKEAVEYVETLNKPNVAARNGYTVTLDRIENKATVWLEKKCPGWARDRGRITPAHGYLQRDRICFTLDNCIKTDIILSI